MTSISHLIPLLVDGYEDKCKELGIIQRGRKIKNPADLMLLCLLHLNNGCSLMDVSEVARLSNIGDFSDVAFMKKFAKCGAWFQWISENLSKVMTANYKPPTFLANYRPIAFDASTVVEKGASGRTYRLHYGIDIFGMSSTSHKITTQDIGETLTNFKLEPGDLAIADRAYGTQNSIVHCLNAGADFVLRLRANHFCLYDAKGSKVDIISKISGLKHEETTEVLGFIKSKGIINETNNNNNSDTNYTNDNNNNSDTNYTNDNNNNSDTNNGNLIPVRICVRRKSAVDCEKSKKKLLREKTSKQRRNVRDKTIKFNEYVVVATSLSKDITAEEVLETYRLRWQIEILFKRLKSILDFGELPKKSEESSLAWLNGKLMVALLIEQFLGTSLFFPDDNIHKEHLERDKAN